ncbi:MAG TPA: FHA domain-containing protein [Roseiflexaceae bacterium]|nr:FHA domain-containing protein [Roseiflexaceae bacterium]
MPGATVLITYPDGMQRAMAVDSHGLRVGRAPDNDLVLVAPGVAPYHAVIRCAGQGRTRVQAGEPEQAGRPLLIEVPAGGEAGAAVRVGGYTIRLTSALHTRG